MVNLINFIRKTPNVNFVEKDDNRRSSRSWLEHEETKRE